jgi:hypothetical protein
MKATASGDVFVAAQTFDASSPRIDVHETIYRMRADGGSAAAYDVPMHAVDCVARHHAAVSDEGDVLALRVHEKFVEVVRLKPRTVLTFLTNFLREPRSFSLRRGLLQAMNEVAGATPAYAYSAVDSGGRITRDKVVANACEYLKTTWNATPANIDEQPSLNLCSCDTTAACAGYRTSPSNRVKAGAVTGLPYNWGGSDSLDRFGAKIQAGVLAGNICLKNSGVPGVTAGVDCSGFAWRALGQKTGDRYTTRTIPNWSDEVLWQDFRPGDVLNKEGAHVMVNLYKIKSRVPGKPEDTIRVIESTPWSKCEGVCATSYQLAELNRSKPVQLKEAIFGDETQPIGRGYFMRRAKYVDEPAQPLTKAQLMCWQ